MISKRSISSRKLFICVILLIAIFLAEWIGGTLFKSLGLVSDAFHVLADVLALLLSFIAIYISHQKSPSDKMSYGYHRLEVFSALINGLTLCVISIFIMIEAIKRTLVPLEVHSKGTLIIAAIGLLINLVCMYVLRQDKHDLNIRSAYLHVLGDALASLSVIVGTSVIYFTQIYWIDGVVAFIISVLILISALRILIAGTLILLQKAPHELKFIRESVRSIEGVLDIDDVRLWQVCSSIIIGTAHIITRVERLEETERISGEIKVLLAEEYGIRHLTLEFETPEMAERHSHELLDRHDHS